ncbi:MAG: AsmA family protein, partial [Verrucomicrobiales bacterium]
MKIGKPLRRVLRPVVLVLGVLFLALLLLAVFRVPLSLNRYRPELAAALEQFLQRPVSLEGDLRLRLGFSPELELEGLRIANAPGWGEGDFAHLQLLRARVEAAALFRGELRVVSALVKQSRFHPAIRKDGVSNWEPETPGGELARGSEGVRGKSFRFVEVSDFVLEDVEVSFVDDAASRNFDLRIDEARGRAPEGQGIELDLGGGFQGKKVSFKAQGGSLASLLEPEGAWPFEAETGFGAITAVIKGTFDAQGPKGEFRLQAPHLDDLEVLLSELPPKLGAVELRMGWRFSEGVLQVVDLDGSLGESPVTGQLEVEFGEGVPRLDGELKLGRLDPALFYRSGEGGQEDGGNRGRGARGADRSAGEEKDRADYLVPFHGELRLAIGEMPLRGDAAIEEMEIRLSIGQEIVAGEVSLQFLGTHFKGGARLQQEDGDEISLELGFVGEEGDVGDLVRYLLHTDEYDGSFRRIGY